MMYFWASEWIVNVLFKLEFEQAYWQEMTYVCVLFISRQPAWRPKPSPVSKVFNF